MSKEFNLLCPKHGHMKIEVEKPPVISIGIFCPWCAQKLMRSEKEVKERQQLNLVGKGAPA